MSNGISDSLGLKSKNTTENFSTLNKIRIFYKILAFIALFIGVIGIIIGINQLDTASYSNSGSAIIFYSLVFSLVGFASLLFISEFINLLINSARNIHSIEKNISNSK